MNKFVDWTLVDHDDDSCGKCGMKEDPLKKGCCKDEHKQLKIDSDQQKSAPSNFTALINVPADVPLFYVYKHEIISSIITSAITFHPPPDIALPKRSILYCCFLI